MLRLVDSPQESVSASQFVIELREQRRTERGIILNVALSSNVSHKVRGVGELPLTEVDEPSRVGNLIYRDDKGGVYELDGEVAKPLLEGVRSACEALAEGIGAHIDESALTKHLFLVKTSFGTEPYELSRSRPPKVHNNAYAWG